MLRTGVWRIPSLDNEEKTVPICVWGQRTECEKQF